MRSMICHGSRNAPGGIDHRLFELGQQGGTVIGRAAEHDAVKTRRQRFDRGSAVGHAAVEHNGEPRPLEFQPLHVVVLERRNLPIFLGRQAAE